MLGSYIANFQQRGFTQGPSVIVQGTKHRGSATIILHTYAKPFEKNHRKENHNHNHRFGVECKCGTSTHGNATNHVRGLNLTTVNMNGSLQGDSIRALNTLQHLEELDLSANTTLTPSHPRPQPRPPRAPSRISRTRERIQVTKHICIYTCTHTS